MKFSFSRAGRSVLITSAVTLVASLGYVDFGTGQAAAAQAAGGQATQGTGQAGQKNYKDRAEYDLYSKITQTQDPKARLDLLNQWQDKYPTSDFADDRLKYFINTLAQLAPNDPAARQQLLQKCQEMLKKDPKYFLANYYIALWGPAVGGTTPPPDLLTQVDTAAHAVLDGVENTFGAAKKPATVSDTQWTTLKNQAMALAHNALAWEAASKKDTATAENEYKASLQANPDQGTVSAAYGKLLIDDKKYPEGLFEYARAAQYSGPGPAVAPDARAKLLDYFNKAYSDFHGSADGADKILADAKTNALPPAGDLNITSAADLANAAAAKMNDRINSDPQFKLWYTIKQSLTGDQGDVFFNSNVKDAEIPGGAEGVKDFTGTVISIDPPDHPTKVVLGIEDPTKPDATLEFTQPLPASALDKVKVGQKLDFSGVADSYNKDPYMLTFKDPTIPGVQTTAPARHGTHHRAATH